MPRADANIAKEKESEEDEDETDEVSLCVNIGLRIIIDIILILQNELEYEAARLNFNLNSNIFWVFKGHMKWKLRISCYCSFLSKLKIQNDLSFSVSILGWECWSTFGRRSIEKTCSAR